MNFSLCVFLYSKYSTNSQKLLDIITKSNIDLTKEINMEFVNIDNQKIREKILKNKSIDVSSVPCILLIYSNGQIEKYENEAVFKWINEILNFLLQSNQSSDFQNQELQRQKMQLEEERKQLELEKNKLIEIVEKKTKKNIERDKSTGFTTKTKKAVKVTSIDDLESEDDENEEEFVPQLPQTNSSGNRSSSSSNAAIQKSSDIMSKAKELAKGREESDPPPPPGHPLASTRT